MDMRFITPIPGVRRAEYSTPTIVLSHDKSVRVLIDELLRRSGLTQSEAARRLGINRSTIQKYRDGRVKRPSFAWFVRLAEVCGARVCVDFPAPNR